jgi:hypothetical protein
MEEILKCQLNFKSPTTGAEAHASVNGYPVWWHDLKSCCAACSLPNGPARAKWDLEIRKLVEPYLLRGYRVFTPDWRSNYKRTGLPLPSIILTPKLYFSHES